MTSNGLILQCQLQGGQRHILRDLFHDSLVQDLKEKLFQITDIPCYAQRILMGFPPKELDLSNDNAQLTSVGITSGDTLIIEKNTQRSKEKQNVKQCTNKQQQQQLTRKIVPADNSCLFASISYVMLGDTSFSSDLRDLIVRTVSGDPMTFNEAFLGKSNEEYCQWISDPGRWGGAIEIAILSQHYHTEINVVNTESGRIDRFGEDKNYTNRVFLIYDGIHYDPLAVISPNGSPIQTVFNCNDLSWIAEAEAIGSEAREKRQFTNVNKFQLRCLICGISLSGQASALAHAKETTHTNFGEV